MSADDGSRLVSGKVDNVGGARLKNCGHVIVGVSKVLWYLMPRKAKNLPRPRKHPAFTYRACGTIVSALCEGMRSALNIFETSYPTERIIDRQLIRQLIPSFDTIKAK